jgi:hypothetical protein
MKGTPMTTPTDAPAPQIKFPDYKDFDWLTEQQRIHLGVQLFALVAQLVNCENPLERLLSDILKSLHVKHAFFVEGKLMVDRDETLRLN